MNSDWEYFADLVGNIVIAGAMLVGLWFILVVLTDLLT